MKNFKVMFVSCENDKTTLHKIQPVISSGQNTVITQLSLYVPSHKADVRIIATFLELFKTITTLRVPMPVLNLTKIC